MLRPGVERRFKVDLDAFFFAARIAENLSAEARRLRLVEVVDTLARSVAIEMDLRLEAAALSEMAENTKDDPDFRVPTVDWNLTGKGRADARSGSTARRCPIAPRSSPRASTCRSSAAP